MQFIHMSLFVTLAAISVNAFVSFDGDDGDKVTCDRAVCKANYSIGSAQCKSGYEPINLEAKGSPSGSYCERSCHDGETKRCNEETCAGNLKACSQGGPRDCRYVFDVPGCCKQLPLKDLNTIGIDSADACTIDEPG